MLSIPFSIGAESSTLPVTDDCADDAVEAKEIGVPILMVFSADDCDYCERLKNDVLKPGIESNQFDRQVLIREVDINAGGKIIDFDGVKVRTGIFVDRYNIYATPTIVIVDYNGTPLASPIVGYNNEDSFRQLLSERIEYAILALDMAQVAAE
ncbi:MAG: thioredoxin fold domain-containing protein [Chromatiales bacterium]|nr:thioredoxin fold domain-containing protein [Chromatiales bacterium]